MSSGCSVSLHVENSSVNTDINLSELQKSLDSTALELVDNQKENMVGRKKLAEQTRGELIRLYQGPANIVG